MAKTQPYKMDALLSKDAQDQRLSQAVQKNIQTILERRREEARRQTLQDRIAKVITDFSGRMIFVYVHVIWFAAWFAFNTGKLGVPPFDPFPYGLLTMVVSLEAIFLSTFVLISQNRMSERDHQRAELDLQINLLTERELTRVLVMLNEIQAQLGVAQKMDDELADLLKETHPEDIMDEIEREEDKAQDDEHQSQDEDHPLGA